MFLILLVFGSGIFEVGSCQVPDPKSVKAGKKLSDAKEEIRLAKQDSIVEFTKFKMKPMIKSGCIRKVLLILKSE